MRSLGPYLLTLALLPAALAQRGYIGGGAGFGVAKGLTVTNPKGSATAGLKPGAALSGFAGHDLYNHLSGELRYTYRFGNLKLSSGGTEYTFDGLAHAVHYDLLVFAKGREAAVRPFAAVGGGVRFYRGTGKEHASQPLSSFAILTKTSQVEGLISAGGGIQVKVGRRVFLRVEFRDYVTPVPKQVITPVPGSKINCWLHDFTPMAGISFGF